MTRGGAHACSAAPPSLRAVVLYRGLLCDGSQRDFDGSVAMLDKPAPAAGEAAKDTAERWVQAFDAALRARSDRALADCFVDDSHWRNLFGISWLFATFSGRAAVVRALLQRAADFRATSFRV